jgi:hypothetical protein
MATTTRLISRSLFFSAFAGYDEQAFGKKKEKLEDKIRVFLN